MKLYCDRYVCYFCGLSSEPSKTCRSLVEVHHLIERYKGGTNEPHNLIPCCSTCHSRIHNNMIKLDNWYNIGSAMKMKWEYKGKSYFGQNKLPL